MLVVPKELPRPKPCWPVMFEPSAKPRLFGLPPGADFPKYLVKGLIERADSVSPETLGRTTLIVNTRRMARRIRALFDAGPTR